MSLSPVPPPTVRSLPPTAVRPGPVPVPVRPVALERPTVVLLRAAPAAPQRRRTLAEARAALQDLAG